MDVQMHMHQIPTELLNIIFEFLPFYIRRLSKKTYLKLFHPDYVDIINSKLSEIKDRHPSITQQQIERILLKSHIYPRIHLKIAFFKCIDIKHREPIIKLIHVSYFTMREDSFTNLVLVYSTIKDKQILLNERDDMLIKISLNDSEYLYKLDKKTYALEEALKEAYEYIINIINIDNIKYRIKSILKVQVIFPYIYYQNYFSSNIEYIKFISSLDICLLHIDTKSYDLSRVIQPIFFIKHKRDLYTFAKHYILLDYSSDREELHADGFIQFEPDYKHCCTESKSLFEYDSLESHSIICSCCVPELKINNDGILPDEFDDVFMYCTICCQIALNMYKYHNHQMLRCAYCDRY